MIRITDINGRQHLLHKDAIARLTEGGPSSQWHGIRTYVRTFDGTVIEAQETLSEIERRIAEEGAA